MAEALLVLKMDIRTPARPYPEYVKWLAETVLTSARIEAERRGERLAGLPTWWVEVDAELTAANECRLVYESATEPADGLDL